MLPHTKAKSLNRRDAETQSCFYFYSAEGAININQAFLRASASLRFKLHDHTI